MRAELKAMLSPDLQKPRIPDEPDACAVLIQAEIGPKGSEGAEIFQFEVVTPRWLLANPQLRWARSQLFLPEFSWNEVEALLKRLVSSVSGETWEEIAIKLSRYMHWEFEDYKE